MTVRWSVNNNERCVEFRQRQPAEYLVTPHPPEGWQVGDAFKPEFVRPGQMSVNLPYGVTAMVLRRVGAQGQLRLRLPDGSTSIVYGPTP